MGEIKARNSKRTLVSWDEFTNLTGQAKTVCVDLGVLSIIRSLLRQRGLWKSTYYQEIIDNDLYREIDDDQFDIIDARIAEFLEEADLTTCSELTEAIKALAQAGGGSGCGCGSGGAGGADVGPTTETGPPDITDPTGDPPEGFATWEEYQDYRCKVAHAIYADQLDDVQWAATVNILSLTGASVAVAFATPIPGDELIALIALLATISGLGIYQSALAAWSNALINAKTELICAMYIADNVDSAIANFTAVLDTAIEAETSDDVTRTMLKAARWAFTSYVVFNDLFEKSAKYNLSQVDRTDCASCEQPAERPMAQIVGVDSNYEFKSWITEISPGRWRVQMPDLRNWIDCGAGITYVNFIWQNNRTFNLSNPTYGGGFVPHPAPCGTVNAWNPGGNPLGPERITAGGPLLTWLADAGNITGFYVTSASGPFIFEFDWSV